MANAWGLSFKLILYVATGAIITSLAAGVARIKMERSDLGELINHSGQNMANTTAAGAASLVMGYDYGNLEILARNVADQPNVISVSIQNKDGRTMTQTSVTQNRDYRRFLSPIVFDGAVIGTVSVDISTKPLELAVSKLYTRIISEQVLLAVILSAIVYFFVSRGIVSPIHRLSTTMETTINNGEPYIASKIEVTSSDEIGRLIMAFNKLNLQLASNYEKLQSKIDLADETLKKKNVDLLTRTQELEHALEKLNTMAATDWLTNLPNRRQFDKMFEQMISQAERYSEPMSLVLLDIDNFKNINDTYGHAAGDQVLQHIAACLTKYVRRSDSPARLGGDEFAVLLYHTDEQSAEKFVSLVLGEIKAHFFDFDGKKYSVTLSSGISQYGSGKNSKESLYFAADQALYASKNMGRDRYTVHSQLPREAI